MNNRNRLLSSALLCVPFFLLTACADDGDGGGMAIPDGSTGAGSGSTAEGSGTTGEGGSGTTSEGSEGGSESSSEGTGTETGSDSGSTGSSSIVVSGGYADFLSGAQIQGATICVRNQPDVECATTERSGTFELVGVEPGSVVLQFSHEDSPLHITHLFGETDFSGFHTVLSRAAITLFADLSGGKLDPTRGTITLSVVDSVGIGVEGVTAQLTDSDGALGPIYVGESGLPDPEATATTGSGIYGWANVSPGNHTVTVSHPTRTCTNSLDPDGSAGNTIEVAADAVSSAWRYVCD